MGWGTGPVPGLRPPAPPGVALGAREAALASGFVGGRLPSHPAFASRAPLQVFAVVCSIWLPALSCFSGSRGGLLLGPGQGQRTAQRLLLWPRSWGRLPLAAPGVRLPPQRLEGILLDDGGKSFGAAPAQ